MKNLQAKCSIAKWQQHLIPASSNLLLLLTSCSPLSVSQRKLLKQPKLSSMSSCNYHVREAVISFLSLTGKRVVWMNFLDYFCTKNESHLALWYVCIITLLIECSGGVLVGINICLLKTSVSNHWLHNVLCILVSHIEC